MRHSYSAALCIGLLFLAGCKTGFNRTHNRAKDPSPPPCATQHANPNLSAEGRRVFKLLAGLTCSNLTADGYLMGQNAGFGNQVAIDSNRGYDRLFKGLDNATTHTPAVLSIDYAHDATFSINELLEANDQLKAHWDAGGLVTISWMPLSPWVAEPAAGQPSTILYENAGSVNLADLLNDTTAAHDAWREKLDQVAAALEDLQEQKVPVLWRPLPEMNKNTYWWGTQASNPTTATNAKLFTDLWKDMYDYLTEEKGLNNLLWVYSPGESPNDSSSRERGVAWAYPGDDYVDVVAGIARHDALQIKDYQALIDLKRPVGMAEYGPVPTSKGGTLVSATKTFDAKNYADRLHGSYKAVAYWVSWHSYADPTTGNAEAWSYMALVDSAFVKELTDRDYVFSLERLVEKKLRD
jgi:mannan endo-1,4-beta-mannosidase